MIHQKPWFQLFICTASIAVLLCPSPAHAWQHSKKNYNNIIQQALQAHGIILSLLEDEEDDDSGVLLQDPPPPAAILEYPIFHGKSALRSLPDSCRTMVQRELSLMNDNDNDQDDPSIKNKTKVALLLLLAGYGDAAHDVLLGTTYQNLEEAEYAATHRGQTNWANKHPLLDLDDVLHSIIHRMCEGSLTGEGGYTGYENAQYWCAGGPKQYPMPIAATEMMILIKNEKEVTAAGSTSPSSTTTSSVLGKVYRELCQLALERAPICVSRGIVVVVAQQQAAQESSKSTDDKKDFGTVAAKSSSSREGGKSHTIIAGGGKFRQVFVPEGCWDPITFCQLLLENEMTDVKDKNLQSELEYLTEKELELLTKYLLLSS